jgi:hypothetical protein
MTYLKVRWKHNSSEYPVVILSELLSDRMESRKIEYYADGRIGMACQGLSIHGAVLGELPVPTEDEISRDPEFEVCGVTAEDFELSWNDGLSAQKDPDTQEDRGTHK